jgi:Beta-propeller repeat
MSISAVSASKRASPPPRSGAAVAPRPAYFKGLSNAGMAALKAADIGAMQAVEMAALSTSQIKAFDPQALASGLPAYLNNKQVLPSNFVSSLGNNQISLFGASLVSATLVKMSVSQIGVISTSAISGIDVAALQSLSSAQLGGFSQSQANQFSTTQIGSLKQQIKEVAAVWLNKLSSAQLLSLGNASIGAFTKAQIAGLDPSHVRYLSGSSTINLVLPQLSANQISAIDGAAAGGISLDALKKLSNDQLKGVTVDQFSHFTKEDINWVVSNKFNIGFNTQQKNAINARKVETTQPTKAWTQLLGTNSYEWATAATAGNDGAIYVAGATGGNLDGQTSSGQGDIFFTKFNADGTKGWTKLLGTSSDEFGAALTTGVDGSIYVTGITSGNMDSQAKYGGYDYFFTKFSAAGAKQWTKLLGSSSDDGANAITTGADGSMYVVGNTTGALYSQTNSGGYDGFVTKFDANGAQKWTKLMGTSGTDDARGVTTGADGSVYVTGYTTGNLNGQSNSGGRDAFITKFNPDGTKGWTKLLGTSADDSANAITTGADGSIYVTGYTNGNLEGQVNRADGGSFVTKFNTDGTKNWTKLLGTSGNYSASAMASGKDGAIYVSGYISGSPDGQTNIGHSDAFTIKVNPDGTMSGTTLLGSTADSGANAMAAGKDGSIYVAGQTNGSLDGKTNGGSSDAFIAKYLI